MSVAHDDGPIVGAPVAGEAVGALEVGEVVGGTVGVVVDGARVGAVGAPVGAAVGSRDGGADGLPVGSWVGAVVGVEVDGDDEGEKPGGLVGAAVGAAEGAADGSVEGLNERGDPVGTGVLGAKLGVAVGSAVGVEPEGPSVGAGDGRVVLGGSLGAALGTAVGCGVVGVVVGWALGGLVGYEIFEKTAMPARWQRDRALVGSFCSQTSAPAVSASSAVSKTMTRLTPYLNRADHTGGSGVQSLRFPESWYWKPPAIRDWETSTHWLRLSTDTWVPPLLVTSGNPSTKSGSSSRSRNRLGLPPSQPSTIVGRAQPPAPPTVLELPTIRYPSGSSTPWLVTPATAAIRRTPTL